MAAIWFLDHWKTELCNVGYSNAFSISMFCIRAPTVMACLNAFPANVLKAEELKPIGNAF